jgi:hypothetical protein
MVTNRTPIGRPPKSRISPAAVAVFKEMLKLEARCRCKPIDRGTYWEHQTCKYCERWWNLNSILVDELKLFPGSWPSYQRSTLFPAGPPAAEGWKPDLESQRRYRMLCEAAGIEVTP